jgi:hypothetical protein
VAKKHPQYHHLIAGGDLLATSGRGLYFDPHPSQGLGTIGVPGGSRGENGLFTGEGFSLRLVELTKRPVRTSRAPATPRRGR